MAGFFSSAGLGAFVKGFADQANENIDRQKTEDRQNDLIWANKFEKGKAEYEKESKEAKEKTKFYNTLVDTFQGNKKAADLAFQVAGQNPKNSMQAISWVSENITAGKLPMPEGYQATSLSDIQANLSSKYQNLEELKGSARQGSMFRTGNSYAGNTQMPMAPSEPMPTSTPAPQGFTPPSSAPQPATSNQPIGISTPGDINPSTGAPASYGPTGAIKGGSGGIDTQIGNAPPSGAPISLDSPAATATSPNTAAPTQMAQADPYANSPVVPYRSPATQAQINRDDVQRQSLDLERKKFEFQQQTRPASPEQKANLEAGNKVAIDFFTDGKNGVEANHQKLIEAQALRYDMNSMLELVNKGMLAKSGQEVIDNLNKITAPYLGLDLSNPQLGFANKISDVNLLKKDIANALIDRLKTMHFGRITNYTERMTLQGMPSTNNDPDTNVRIVLAINDTLKSALEVNGLVQNVLYSRENQEALKNGTKTWVDLMFEAKLVAKEYNDKYLNKQEPFPILNNPQEAAQLEPGTWFENKHDHRMYRFIGAEGGSMKFQNAGTKIGGLPETFTLPIGQ